MRDPSGAPDVQSRFAAVAGETRAFRVVIVACAVFFGLTVAAMVLYPGGRVGDVDSNGYAFFKNFFSDLGQTRTHSGASNFPSLVLFCVALVATAAGIGLFFVSFARLFPRASPGRRISSFGAACGIVAALSFIGVACTPWNLHLQAHNEFVMWAFRAFLLAALCNAVAAGLTPDVPRRFTWIFGTFALLLALYVGLLIAGPKPHTPAGALIQATGQKLIVYASVLTILIASINAIPARRRPNGYARTPP